MKKNINRLFIALISSTFLLFSCSRPSYEKISSALENDEIQLAEKLIEKCDGLTEEQMADLSQTAFNKTSGFNIVRLLCDKGMDINVKINDRSEDSKRARSLLYLSIKYDDEDFFKFVINKGLSSKIFYVDGFNDIFEYALRAHDGKYFEPLWNAVKKDDVSCINLINLLMPVTKNTEHVQDLFYSKPGVEAALKLNPAFTLFVIGNYDKEPVEIIKRYMSVEDLDFSNDSLCLKYAINSESLEAVKWVLSKGVSYKADLELLEEKVSVEEYIQSLMNGHKRNGTSSEKLNEILEYFKLGIRN